ncbi:MAG: protein kinase [Myxococcales bacterium]|nr:protein kinase [Myxococcales bacterium]
MKNRIAARLFAAESGPVLIGRFEVLESAGSGGMGVVYRAWDPTLNREVALKVLHPEVVAEDVDRGRLMREAQALAKLSHPNVVQLFEVGEHDGGFFLAMEYVDGVPLRHWQLAAKRSWRELVSVYVQAGHGLAAAHAVGLVHRDFKPSNVIVGNDGRVRVADFGLARGPGLHPPSPGSPTTRPSPTTATSTDDRVRAGTPAYMSPEQSRGEPTDPRSDQFSFCLSLWEALFGNWPRPGTEAARDSGGSRAESPHASGAVQRRLRATLSRGLRESPDERWPNMKALLETLERLEERRWLVGGGAFAAGVVGVLVWSWGRPDELRWCDRLEATMPRWRDDDMSRLQAAAERFDSRGSAVLASATNETLVSLSERWRTVAESVCEGGGEPAAPSAVGTCLALAARRMEQVGAALRDVPDGLLVVHETLALSIPPERCEHGPGHVASDAGADLPEDAIVALVQARVLGASGREAEALQAYAELEERLPERGSLAAQIELGRGESYERTGDSQAARLHLDRALEHAMAVGDHAAALSAYAIRARIELVEQQASAARHFVGSCLQLLQEVEQPIERAECMAYEALAAPELDVAMALRLLDDALAARRARYGEAHPSESPLRRLIAHVYAQQGDGAAARRIYEEELRRHRVAFGARHPTSLDLDFDLALLDQEQGRYDDAMRRLEEVSEGFEAIYGDTPRLAEPLMVMAMVEAAQGNVAQAVARADRAAELQAELPLDHPESGSALTLAAAIAQAGGDLPRALEAYERLAALRGARATSEQTLVWHNVAYYRCVLSSCERATEALDRVDRQTLSDSGASVRLNVDIVYGLVALSQGDDVYARNYAERVLRGLDEEGVVEPKAFEAEALWILARAARLTGDEQAALQHAVAGLRAAEGLDATIDVLRRLDEDLYARAELVLRDAAIP